ncbi:ESX secretion-associated protein EspG [Actinocrispum wychmicini]|uniref:ESAT-6 protein secretion system EspG family protein n=1 Tax=Actinocrispum wychmicini TaxID=1213861 RepID=A0A4R2JV76_9PSEU|nr:ESX secretion-associated protein EspG [Actinocrispum wychmicini]TCO58055.1 ESAT-6 protein secretion system EspG family protein [Actinocrispum wychmicini]
MISELSLPALDMLWEDMKLGTFPFPLEIRSHGETVEERIRIKTAVYSDLERRGLVRGRRPEPELEDVLRLLARPTISIDAVAMVDMAGEPTKAMVVATGRHALLAVQGDLTVTLTSVRETALTSSIVEVLPHVKAGPGVPVSMPVDDLNARGAHRRPDPEDKMKLQRLAAVMQRPVVRAGQFGITVRDPHGKATRLPGITWFDTDAGRYMNVLRAASDGEEWLTLTPADSGRISHRLSEELLHALKR